jgi:tRNA (guanine37-N1)-methyltransferase
MLAAYTDLKHAQKVKTFLIKKNLMHHDFLAVRELGFIYFTIIKKAKIPHAKVVNTKFLFPEKKKLKTIEELLKSKLTSKQLTLIPKTQEIVGSIMIIEIPEELEKKEKIIAEAYLSKNITTIVKKSKMHTGVFRTRKVKILAGKRMKETIHHENGVKLKLHLEKTYFSARSGNERLRIAKQIKKGEDVLVMFSGAGPFPLVFAKNSDAKHIIGIELNPDAHEYAFENILLNNLEDRVTASFGDVRDILPKMRKKFDRIAMALPKTGEEFLDVALPRVKKDGIIHLYAFLNENDVPTYKKKVREICIRLKYNIRILRTVKCGQFSPGTFRMCFDIKKT